MEILDYLSLPIVSNILILIGLVSLIVSIAKKDLSFALVISFISFILYFIGSLYAGDISLINFALCLLGGLFLALEVFIPGFGIFGIAGIISIIAGIFISSAGFLVKAKSLSIALVFTILIVTFLVKKGIMNSNLKEVVLQSDISKDLADYSQLVGKEGKTLTVLRPAGVIELDSKRYDAITVGQFIEKDSPIRIVKTEGSKIIVEEIKDV